jgi:hypothetical protein
MSLAAERNSRTTKPSSRSSASSSQIRAGVVFHASSASLGRWPSSSSARIESTGRTKKRSIGTSSVSPCSSADAAQIASS